MFAIQGVQQFQEDALIAQIQFCNNYKIKILIIITKINKIITWIIITNKVFLIIYYPWDGYMIKQPEMFQSP